MSTIDSHTVTTIAISRRREIEIRTSIREIVNWITDTMRPGVVCSERKAAAESLLCGEQQSVVASCASVVPHSNKSIRRTPRGIQKSQQPPLIRIGSCGAIARRGESILTRCTRALDIKG